MKNKLIVLYTGLAVLLILTGVVVYKAAFKPAPAPEPEEEIVESLPPVDASVTVSITKSRVKDNTVVLSATGLASKYSSLSYELSYETQGIVQGVTSAPIDITGDDNFARDDIYLGTCSRNVCKPHTGVTKITAVVVFTDTDGQKSQFSGDFEL